MVACPSDHKLFPHITHPKKRAFLAAYMRTGKLRAACRMAEVDSRVHYRWRATDPAYAAAVDEARLLAAEYWEEVAIQRATEGERPSDVLLIFLLKGAFPHRYRDNYVHHQVEGEVTIALEDRTRQANERLMRLRRGQSSEADVIALTPPPELAQDGKE